MDDIGELLTNARESSGISLKEVSTDLNIKEEYLQNIEEGKTGAFIDVYELRKDIMAYAKYLGLDEEKIIEEFNEYIFASTSKISVKDIEKQMIKKNKEEVNDKDKIISPYTKEEKKVKNNLYLVVYIFLLIMLVIAVFWSFKQITINSSVASQIGYLG